MLFNFPVFLTIHFLPVAPAITVAYFKRIYCRAPWMNDNKSENISWIDFLLNGTDFQCNASSLKCLHISPRGRTLGTSRFVLFSNYELKWRRIYFLLSFLELHLHSIAVGWNDDGKTPFKKLLNITSSMKCYDNDTFHSPLVVYDVFVCWLVVESLSDEIFSLLSRSRGHSDCSRTISEFC